MGLFDFGKKKKNDNKKFLLQWQNFLLEKDGHNPSKELFFSKEDLERYTLTDVKLFTGIIEDCKKAINETVNPSVFFSRLNLLIQRAEQLRMYEPYAEFPNGNPSDIYSETVNQYHEITFKFLKRSLANTIEKSDAMKTPKGKINKFHNWYESLKEYYPYMNEKNIHFLESEYQLHTNKLTPKS